MAANKTTEDVSNKHFTWLTHINFLNVCFATKESGARQSETHDVTGVTKERCDVTIWNGGIVLIQVAVQVEAGLLFLLKAIGCAWWQCAGMLRRSWE